MRLSRHALLAGSALSAAIRWNTTMLPCCAKSNSYEVCTVDADRY